MDKEKFVNWLEQEIYGTAIRGETERMVAMKELHTKVTRGYFDKKEKGKIFRN